MVARHDKGLCFNCVERFTTGHKCKLKCFLIIADEVRDPISSSEPPSPDPIDESSPPYTDGASSAHISFNALSGQLAPETIRVRGRVNGQEVIVLIDGGITHNFVQDMMVRFLNLKVQPTKPLHVMVGNGNELTCQQVCKGASLKIQGQSFLVDLHVMPIGGTDLVLGVAWLKDLGPIIIDFSLLTMSFTKDGKLIKLKGETGLGPCEISRTQVRRLLTTDSVAALFHIQMTPSESHPHPTLQPAPHHTDLPEELQHLIHEYSALFQPPTTTPPARTIDHTIHLHPNSDPVNVKPCRYPFFQKQEIEKQVDEMLQMGMIQPSRSPFSSPVLLVKKKDGSWRFCVDYRALNANTIKDCFPLPTIDKLLDELSGASWFSKLDLAQGFHQIRMSTEDIPKTAFRTHQGHYEYHVMPFGLCNAPSTFQAAMNNLFQPFLCKFVLVFFDDILVFSSNFPQHMHHLALVFRKLQEGQFFLKMSKCTFGQRRVEYLGHIVSKEGVELEPSKIQAMLDWSVPHSLKSLHGFLGLTGFYRRFIKDYANIAAPLTMLLRKDQFHWGDEAHAAFEELKSAMTKVPVLALPDFNIPFAIETDASGSGMGDVLLQNNHPIAYFSKQLCPKIL